MNLKDRLIRKLLDFGKKHRLMVYPTLAIVAVISAISHVVCWGKGNGKRVVASVTVVALLITQSLFLTSSAADEELPETPSVEETVTDTVVPDGTEQVNPDNAGVPDLDSSEEQMTGNSGELTEADNVQVEDTDGQVPAVDMDGQIHSDTDAGYQFSNPISTYADAQSINVVYHLVTPGASGNSSVQKTVRSFTIDDDGKARIDCSRTQLATACQVSPDSVSDFTFAAYSDLACTNALADSGSVEVDAAPLISTNPVSSYNVYIMQTRVRYSVWIYDGSTCLAKVQVDVQNPVTGVRNPQVAYTVQSANTYHGNEVDGQTVWKKGYEFVGLDGYAVGDSFNIQSEFGAVKQANANYRACDLPIRYKIAPADVTASIVTGNTSVVQEGTSMSNQPFTFPDISTWAGWVTPNEAYEFAGWRVAGGSVVYSPGESIDADTYVSLFTLRSGDGVYEVPNVEPLQLEAVWRHKNVKLVSSSPYITVSEDGQSATISATYGDEITEGQAVLGVVYADGSQGTQFSSQLSDMTAFLEYGIAGHDSANGIANGGCSFFTNGNDRAKKITTSTQSFTVTVTDNNSSPAETYTFTIYLNIAPKELKINESQVTDSKGNSPIAKTYDGTTDADVINNILLDENSKAFDTDDVSFTYTNARYDSANAGTRDIVLEGVVLTGASAGNYTIGEGTTITIKNKGDIKRRPLEVEMRLKNPDKYPTAAENPVIKFGEPAPEYELVLKESSINDLATVSDNAGNDYASNPAGFMQTYLGFVGWDTDRTLYSPPKSYDVRAEFDDTNKNYAVMGGTIKKSFTVIRDDGIENTNYTRTNSPEVPAGKYYNKIVLAPFGEYTSIRLLGDGDADITDETAASIQWSQSITVPDMDGGTVRFQMKSANGAVTKIVELNDIYVDSKGPELKKVVVTPNNDIHTYIKEYKFGSYYHTQNDIESVTVKLYYTSEHSKCTDLYYSFEDDKGNKTGETKVAFASEQDADGFYVAAISIGTSMDQRGQLISRAENEAGNSSVNYKIKLNRFSELDSDTDYYEWMVENRIDSAVIQVLDGDGNEAVTNTENSGIWYSSLNLLVDAVDTESGVHGITWKFQTPEGEVTEEQTVDTDLVKLYEYQFAHDIAGNEQLIGSYTISAVLEDNAGNTVELSSKGPYNLDCKAPNIDVAAIEDSEIYQASVNLSFTVTEGEGESGIVSAELFRVGPNGDVSIKKWAPASDKEKYTMDCAYEIKESGKYKIKATDRAGNVSTAERVFDKLSTTIPDAPIINISGVEGNNKWYKGETSPDVEIVYQTVTTDGVKVDTFYKVITAATSSEEQIRAGADNPSSYGFTLKTEGTVTIEAWSISEAGIKSAVTTKEIQVDTVAPTIEIVNAEVDANGNLCINFRAKDATSGIDSRKVLLNGEPVAVTEEEGAVVGSFVVDAAKNYTLVVEDYAGNVSKQLEFKPLGLKTTPITDITKDGAYVQAKVIEGTYAVNDYYIAWKQRGDTSYRTALFNAERNGKVIDLECYFHGLESNTVYDYKICASNEKGEIRTYVGSFRTLSPTAVGSVYGNVVYADSVIGKDYPIYVGLYDANTVVASMKLNSAEETAYLFTNIADGAYRVVATNGILTETAAVTIENGSVIYPENYAVNGGITLILNGFNTSVIIDDDAISITADNLESMYDNSVYKGILTNADLQVISEGGSVDISLHASYLDVSEISPDEQSVFDAKLNSNVKIERYINLYVLKEVRNAAGEYVNGTPVRIPELYNPITISFPLGDLAGQQIYVASVHNEGSNYSFMNWANADDVTISQNYITISTRYFSVYALYRLLGPEKTYTVTWKDGDGRTMKTETVVEGKAATPPTEVPTKTAVGGYTYTFSGWDTDYSVITRDMVISARFSAQSAGGGDNPGDTPGDSRSPNSYTYLGSAGSPRTGDGTPIGLLVVIMFLSGAGAVVLKKKNQS